MLGVAAAGETKHARGTERPRHQGDGLGWEAGAQEAPPLLKTPWTYLTIRGQVLARAVYMGDPKQGPFPHSNRSRCQYQLRGAHGTVGTLKTLTLPIHNINAWYIAHAWHMQNLPA